MDHSSRDSSSKGIKSIATLRGFPLLGGSGPRTQFSGFHNHGDRCCPRRIGLWDPFQMAFLWLINGGDPNHLLTGMILQVTAMGRLYIYLHEWLIFYGKCIGRYTITPWMVWGDLLGKMPRPHIEIRKKVNKNRRNTISWLVNLPPLTYPHQK